VIIPKQLHAVEATSTAVRIEKDAPTDVYVNFRLSDGDHLAVALPRSVLERLVYQAKRAMKEAPVPGRARPTGPSATSRNK
jgi:hypothetical protein